MHLGGWHGELVQPPNEDTVIPGKHAGLFPGYFSLGDWKAACRIMASTAIPDLPRICRLRKQEESKVWKFEDETLQLLRTSIHAKAETRF